MAFCGDCREWKPTAHNKDWGWCPDSQLEKHKSEEACGCIYLKREESMMDTCKECKWWRKICDGDYMGVGECQTNTVATSGSDVGAMGRITNPIRETCPVPMKTCGDFGCVHFEQRTKGSFEVMVERGRITLIFRVGKAKHCFYVDSTAGELEGLTQLCDWLNEIWPVSQKGFPMWRCWYCDCTNSEELGRCQYCSGPRRDAKSEGQKGEFKWTCDEDEYWSPYYFNPSRLETSPNSAIENYLVFGTTHPDGYGLIVEKEIEEPVETAYFAPAPAPKRWKIFNFFRKLT